MSILVGHVTRLHISRIVDHQQHVTLLRVAWLQHTSTSLGRLLNLLATPVTLCKGWQSGSNIQVQGAFYRTITH